VTTDTTIWPLGVPRVLVTDAWLANTGDGAIALAVEELIRSVWPAVAVLHAADQADLVGSDLPGLRFVPGVASRRRACSRPESERDVVDRAHQRHASREPLGSDCDSGLVLAKAAPRRAFRCLGDSVWSRLAAASINAVSSRIARCLEYRFSAASSAVLAVCDRWTKNTNERS
jgi:hypothetical protein